MDKNCVFVQCLCQLVQIYFDELWVLIYVNVDCLLDMCDEEMVLCDEEVIGELLVDFEFEEFNEICEQLVVLIEVQLVVYKEKGILLDFGLVVWEFLVQYLCGCYFDVVWIVVDQVVQLGVVQVDFIGLLVKWQLINDYGVKVQVYVIDKY